MTTVNAVCPICRQELTLEAREEDLAGSRRYRVRLSRVPCHPLPLYAVYDGRLAINCPASDQPVYERCNGDHASPECLDPACWARESLG